MVATPIALGYQRNYASPRVRAERGVADSKFDDDREDVRCVEWWWCVV
jgi:hypothetical protein